MSSTSGLFFSTASLWGALRLALVRSGTFLVAEDERGIVAPSAVTRLPILLQAAGLFGVPYRLWQRAVPAGSAGAPPGRRWL
jgi:hypothetical protein